MVDWTGFSMIGGGLATLLALSAIFILMGLAIYIYFALAWQTIGKKVRYKYPWLAWIPVANLAMILQIGGFHWAWVFLLLVPVLGWLAICVLVAFATWKIFEKRKYPGWLALVPLLGFVPLLSTIAWLAYLIVIGFVAWVDRKKR